MWGTPDWSMAVELPRPSGNVVIVGNTKGGVGKSVFSFNVADCLARIGLRVLVVDLDVQCGQLAFLHRPPPDADHDVGAVICGRCEIEAAVQPLNHNLDMLPGNEFSLAFLSRRLDHEPNMARARSAIEGTFDAMRRGWDLTIVDTGGHQSHLLALAMGAADGVVVPIIPEAGPVAELPTVLNMFAATVSASGRRTPRVLGIARTRVWGNAIYRRVAEDHIRDIAGAREIRVYRNKIPEDAKFGEAHLLGLAVNAHEPRARSAIAYRCLAEELARVHDWGSVPTSSGMVASA